jgi:glycosyltransferase involved in cell wall biosynthesis
LESIFPVLQELAGEHEFSLKIVGSGRTEISIPGVEVENLAWELEREVEDFQSFDIGLYPIVPKLYGHEWTAGKSGFKSIQYMAVGIPFVATPVGAVKEIGQMGTTHFCAKTDDEWRSALFSLMTDPKKRADMGWAGRCQVIEHFGLQAQADKFAAALREAAGDL